MKRTIMRYHGGKHSMVDWLLSHTPHHTKYVEVFGGSGAFLMSKPRSEQEVLNDIDGDVVNVYKMIRERPDELARVCFATPYAREEYNQGGEGAGWRKRWKEIEGDPIERARLTIFRSFAGYGSPGGSSTGSGFRAKSGASVHHAKVWARYPEHIQFFCKRLAGVVIESRDWLELVNAWDAADVLFYLDPPYVPTTRGSGRRIPKHKYRFEMDLDGHKKLLERAVTLRGKVMLSGYDHALYRDMLAGWHVESFNTFAEGAEPRTELLFLSPNCEIRGGLGI